MFLNYEGEEKKSKDVGLKFPISLHDVGSLDVLPDIEEKVDYKEPIKKKTASVTVDLNKRSNKNTGSKLF
jgi:hypothetical protein